MKRIRFEVRPNTYEEKTFVKFLNQNNIEYSTEWMGTSILCNSNKYIITDSNIDNLNLIFVVFGEKLQKWQQGPQILFGDQRDELVEYDSAYIFRLDHDLNDYNDD